MAIAGEGQTPFAAASPFNASPNSRGAFSRHGEAVETPGGGATTAAPVSLRSASHRLFLSGLLASRARLRFTGWSHSEALRRGLSIADETHEKAQQKSA